VVVLSVLMLDRVGVDDPVGAVSVHGVCGALGTILLGLFHTENGLLYGGGAGFFVTQLIGVVSVAAFCVVSGLVLFKVISLTVGLRVTPDEELEGLDIGEHGNVAYPEFRTPVFGDTGSGTSAMGRRTEVPVGEPLLARR